jgi:hypothetical protein
MVASDTVSMIPEVFKMAEKYWYNLKLYQYKKMVFDFTVFI